MPRIARVVLPGIPLHITQRGIRRLNVFGNDADRRIYVELLQESCRRFHLRICAYCLMTNHVHFVAIPESKDSVWKTFHRCHGIYAKQFNMRYAFTGHLWQARPFSCALDDDHLWAAIRYVERNPVRAHMVECAEDYGWSSAAAHCGLREDRLLDPEWISSNRIHNWSQWLAASNPSKIDQRLRDRTFTGRPCGDETFIKEAERLLGRHLAPQKPGPKPQQLTVITTPSLWTSDDVRS
jgi:putative transposase